MTETVASAVLRVGRADVDLVDHPINPDWILEGSPQARLAEWGETPDGTTSHWTWDCTAGRFRWYYAVDESIVVVEGGMTLQVDGEPPLTLAVGDAAYFQAGNWVTWTVEKYVRKQAVVRVPVPRAMRYAVNGFGRRAHRLR